MVARKKAENKIILDETKEKTSAAKTVNTTKSSKTKSQPAKKGDTKKVAPIMANLDVLSYMLIKKILLRVYAVLGIKPPKKDVFGLLTDAGLRLKLERYELGKGADYTRDYLERILEKVNGK